MIVGATGNQSIEISDFEALDYDIIITALATEDLNVFRNTLTNYFDYEIQNFGRIYKLKKIKLHY